MLYAKLQKLIRNGDLTVSCAGGAPRRFKGAGPGPSVSIRITDVATAWRIALHPDLYLGEAYTDGALTVERGTVAEFLDLCGRNVDFSVPTRFHARAFEALRRVVHHLNARTAAQRNAAHHYDIDRDLYRTFLDEDLQYSCAYFPALPLGLDEAQRAKKEHIAAKLLLHPGQRVLDVGCGWGGLALHLARHHGVTVHGITLSREQLLVCQERARDAGLADRVRFDLLDYRDLDATYDRIVSVGMFEHVGRPNYDSFFAAVARHLALDGVALVHSIGRAHGPSYTSSWIRKHIFPGGYAPAVSEVMPSVERSGLWVADLEVLRLHYAETLRLWRERFVAARDRLPAGIDDRFVRMWEFYLAASEMSFRHQGLMVFQAQLAHEPDAVPLTRDYMYAPTLPAREGEVAVPAGELEHTG